MNLASFLFVYEPSEGLRPARSFIGEGIRRDKPKGRNRKDRLAGRLELVHSTLFEQYRF